MSVAWSELKPRSEASEAKPGPCPCRCTSTPDVWRRSSYGLLAGVARIVGGPFAKGSACAQRTRGCAAVGYCGLDDDFAAAGTSVARSGAASDATQQHHPRHVQASRFGDVG